ncbi:peptide chain release factor N(5)-glutamine methyltransferase [Kangiella marina]|uniref:Release factor glutamine methyltransferase n=1 Tax=Kangiella marina TaxID=1079178 RepID=A0ABP8IM12_9GAMM
MTKTVQEVLQWAVLELANTDNAKLDAEVLLAETLEQSRTWLKTWSDKPISEQQLAQFKAYIGRRQQGEPVAYIVGRQDFWTLSLKVTPATLIPRPETEHLVESVLSKAPHDQPLNIVDLGTGTGAIALAIASERPQCQVWAMDVSDEALAVAEHNRQQLQLENVTCRKGHWLRNWTGEGFDLIVSNPPYIEPNDPHLKDLTYEPISALVADDDGLSDIKEITEQAMLHLKAGGWLMLEHGYNQGGVVRHILQTQGFACVETEADYAGLDRVTYGQKLNFKR